MAVTARCITEDCKLEPIVLYFPLFMSPHTGDDTCALLYDVLESWNLCKKVREITSDNVSDVCNGISKLLGRLLTEAHTTSNLEDFHLLCFANVVSLGVEECLGLIGEETLTIRSLINSIRASVKRRDIFASVKIELGDNANLPVLDVETKGSSTFPMIKYAFTAW